MSEYFDLLKSVLLELWRMRTEREGISWKDGYPTQIVSPGKEFWYAECSSIEKDI